MSLLLLVLGLALGAFGVLLFLGGQGLAAIQGGILLIMATLLLCSAFLLEELINIRRALRQPRPAAKGIVDAADAD